MNAAEIPFGGGVSPRFTRRLKGQSIIEYVLIIAIMVLVVLIAGPWVSSAIRNQFNLVAGAIGNGIDKGGWESGGTGGGSGSLTDADIVDPVHGTAFAVYSAEDRSLMFYKRKGLPKVGDMLNSRRVTEVYTGFETETYQATWDTGHNSINNGPTNCPWFKHHDDILSVSVVDYGIKPHDMSFWFQLFSIMRTVDIKRFNMSDCVNWQHAFWHCDALTVLDLSGMNVERLANIESMCTACYSLKTVSFAGWKGSPTSIGIMFGACRALDSVEFGELDFSKMRSARHAFSNCRSLMLDCSNWDVSTSADRTGFNAGAPGVIAPKVWTTK